jgi:hypothetical protein
MRLLVAAALALACVAVVLIYVPERRPVDPMPRPEAPVDPMPRREAPVEEIESGPPSSPPPPPPETPARPVSRLRRRGPIEKLEEPFSPHFTLMNSIVDTRLDAVDQCRERFTLPPIRQLLARSTIISESGVGTRAQEAGLQQTFLFEIASADDAYFIDDVEVMESWLEFPAPDGTMRRLSFDDVALDRCIEGVLRGTRFDAKGVAKGERFWIEGHAGEAVYDLPPR